MTSRDAHPPFVSPRIAALQGELEAGHRGALDAFWHQVSEQGTPLIEAIPGDADHALVTFVWRGNPATHNVVVIGSFTRWDYVHNQMSRVRDTDLWSRTYRLHSDTRTTYRLSENDALIPVVEAEDPGARTATWRPDPLNRQPFPAANPWASVLVLPGAPPQPWIAPRPGVPAGMVHRERLRSDILGNERDIWTYIPPGYSSTAEPYSLLLLFDGGAYTSWVPTPTILDNLLAEQRIAPLVAVFVGNAGQAVRNRELPCHPPFAEFLAQELIPWVRQRNHVTDDATRTVIGGSSYGGLAAAYAGLRSPDLFGNVLSQSGSFSWKPADEAEYGWLTRQFASNETLPLHFYLEIGLPEAGGHERTLDEAHPGPVAANRHLRTVLQAKRYLVSYAEFTGGHDYVCWRGTLAEGLLALLEKEPG